MKKVYKRLLSVLLALVMVVGVIPFSDLMTVKAATISKGTVIYFNTNGINDFTKDGAVPSVCFKTSATDSNGDFVLMEQVSGTTIYKAECDRDNVSHVQFRRSSSENTDWKSATAIMELGTDNCYTINSWSVKSSSNNSGAWSTYPEITPAAFAGKTVYVTGVTATPTITITNNTSATMTAVMNADGTATGVYKYTFASNVEVGNTFSISNVSGTFDDISTNTPCYDASAGTWVAYTEPIIKATITLSYPGDNAPAITCVEADGDTVAATVTDDTFEFDFSKYTGFYAAWNNALGEDANATKIQDSATILKAVESYTRPTFVIGKWIEGQNRTGEWTDGAVGAVPEGTIKQETGSYYVTSTFYDYFSDYELTSGMARKYIKGDTFDTSSGSSDKIQADTFNKAVSSYFETNKTNDESKYKPLYFGEFESITSKSEYYNYDQEWNNSAAWGGQAHQGLVDSSLANATGGDITMGGVKLPYFDEEFLLGENNTGDAIGQVYENVQFPFIENEDGYWEFDSLKGAQSLRMKKTSDGAYFLDRTGTGGQVNATNGSAKDTGESGFFPFNDKTESGIAKKLNYGFGVRFDIPFNMTADGKVEIKDGENESIVYEFSGDDDVWVYIDGQLVLDIGGDHGRIYGKIDFGADDGMTATVYKKGSDEALSTKTFTRPSSTSQHTLTMFYMERGLWESNMKITFNFPRINTLSVEKEVDTTDVSDDFKAFVDGETTVSLEDSLAAVNVKVENLATRGDEKNTGSDENTNNYNYNLLDDMSKVSFSGSPSQKGITTDTSNKSGRSGVLMVKYAAQLKDDTTNAASHRVIIKPQAAETFNANFGTGTTSYLQFEMYNEGKGSCGVPYVQLTDSSGNTVGAYVGGSYAYDNNNNTLYNKWVTVKVDLAVLAATNKAFDLSKIKEIQIGYWDSGYIFLDNVQIFKANNYTVDVNKFATKQYDIPTYNSITTGKLQKAVGAVYEYQVGNNTATAKYIDASGTIALVNNASALFTDQFRIGSYVSLEEDADQDYYTTSWELFEDSGVYASGNGTAIEDNRVESEDYAAETESSGSAMAWHAVSEEYLNSVNTMLYRSNARTNDIITPTNLTATFINKVNTDSLKITKAVSEDDLEVLGKDTVYSFEVVFSNIFGQVDKTVTKTYELKAGGSVTIEGIPVGTSYVITEKVDSDANYKVMNIAQNNAKDTGSADVEKGQFSGIISIGENVDKENPDEIVFTNEQIPDTLDKVFYVESGKLTDLPMNLTTLTSINDVAAPNEAYSTVHASVPLKMNGTNVSFDCNSDGSAANESVYNEAYTFHYTGRNSEGSVEGDVTVYTFKATNDIYVFDYGLKSDLADNSTNWGMFANDILFNDYAETEAKLNGLKTSGTTWESKVALAQSKITANSGSTLTRITNSNGASNSDKVWFTPTAFMDKKETFYYQTWVLANGRGAIGSAEDGVALDASVTVMPANSVYYEDNFNASADNDGTLKIVYTDSVAAFTTEPTKTQSNDQSENYGHDNAYANDLKESGGSCTTMNSGDGAYFTFTGTGFDIVSRTNNSTAGIVAYVYEGKKTEFSSDDFKANATGLVKAITVDTYYNNGDLYQVPVISTTLASGTYTVYIKALKTYTGQSVIYIDGIRIYNPLSDTSDYLETEQSVVVKELRSFLFDNDLSLVTKSSDEGYYSIDQGTTVVENYDPDAAKDGDWNYGNIASIATVMLSGPNNELYIPVDNGIGFQVKKPATDDWTLQIGAKSVNEGSAFAVYAKPTGVSAAFELVATYSVKTPTDMYYDVKASSLNKVIEEKGWSSDNYDIVVLNTTEYFDTYDFISLTTIKYSGTEISKISTVARSGYSIAGRTAATVENAIISASFDVSNVTRGKNVSMTVVTTADTEDVKVVDPTGAEVSCSKKSSQIDEDGNRVWSLTFKAIKQKGEAAYEVDAVVNGEAAGNPYSVTIVVR